MVIKIAAPILDGDRMTGILYAAVLLNNNTEFIDRFKRLVFKEEKIRGKDVGTTTIFLGDIRVATNVVDSRRAGGPSARRSPRRSTSGSSRRGRSGWTRPSSSTTGTSRATAPSSTSTTRPWASSTSASSSRSTTSSCGARPCPSSWSSSSRSSSPSLLAVYLINVYTKPVKRIIAASTEMARGDYHRIEVRPARRRRRPEPRAGLQRHGRRPSRSATASSRTRPSGPSSSPRSWPRSAGWPRASPTRSTTP